MTDAPAVIINLPSYPASSLPSVSTINALRARASTSNANGDDFAVDGGASIGDGLGGLYVWSAASTEPDNGSFIVKPNDRTEGEAGRYVLTSSHTFDDLLTEDRIQTGLDRAAVAADRLAVEDDLAAVNIAAGTVSADLAAFLAALSANTAEPYASTANALSTGVAQVSVTGAGSAGANGTFSGTFTGGGGTGATFRFVVAGGAVVPSSVFMTSPGINYTSTPTPVFTASAGLTGVTATVTTAPRTVDGEYFSVFDANGPLIYKNVAAAAVFQYALSAQAIPNLKQPLLFDFENQLGGGRVVYLPLTYNYRNGAASTVLTVSNTEATERLGYCKLAIATITSRYGLIFNVATNSYEVYSDFSTAGTIPYPAAAHHKLAVVFDRAVNTALTWQEFSAVQRLNQCQYTTAPESLPRKVGSPLGHDTVDTALIALGFTRGINQTASTTFHALAGDYFTATPGSILVARYFVESDTDDFFGTPLASIVHTPLGGAVSLTPTYVRRLSARAREYEFRFVLPEALGASCYFTCGISVLTVGHQNWLTGVQWAVDKGNVERTTRTYFPAVTGEDLSRYALADRVQMDANRAYFDQPYLGTQRFTATWNVVVCSGQSFAYGLGAMIPLDRTALSGNFMLGNVVRGTGTTTAYDAIGGATLRDLVAKQSAGASVIAYGSETAGLSGQTYEAAMINRLRKLHSVRFGVEADLTKSFIGMNTGVNSMTIEQLSKVNAQDGINRWGKNTDFIAELKTAATAAGVAFSAIRVPVVIWDQGQADYNSGNNQTRALYKAALETYIQDWRDLLLAEFGQTEPPLFLLVPPSGSYVQDQDVNGVYDVHVAMAMREVADELHYVRIACQNYSVPWVSAHPMSNSSRWIGEMISKAANRLLIEGREWSDVRVARVVADGPNDVLVYTRNASPLQAKAVWQNAVSTNVTNKGFHAKDSTPFGGPALIVVSQVDVVGEATIRIRHNQNRAIDGSYLLRYGAYGGGFTNGWGNICDTDPTVSQNTWEYNLTTYPNMPASENVAALVGNPYTMENWMTAFAGGIGYSA